jgi:hypothetical protein
MKLSEEDIKEFQELYKEEFGKEISYQDAYDSAQKLITIVKIIMEPDEV